MSDITHKAPTCHPNPFDLLLQLDSAVHPGLTIVQFLGLFSRCRGCELVMTRNALRVHYCQSEDALDMIDLTEEVEDKV
jgi:hypothetical protein